jgi:hypothetical protein
VKQPEVFMIQLSALLPSGTENPRKTADFALHEGAFGQLLADGPADGMLPGGKILPEGGKTLPDGLPAVEVPSLAGRTLIAQFAAKETKPEAGETGPLEGVEPDTEQDDPAETGELPALPLAALPAGIITPAKVEIEQDILSAPKRQTAYRLQSGPVAEAVPEPVRKAVLEAVAARETPAQPAVAAKLAVTPVLDPGVAEKGERPADAPQPARIAPGARGEPTHEIKPLLSADAQPDARTGGSPERRPAPTASTSQQPMNPHAVQPASLEVAALPVDAPAVRDASAPAQPSQPHAVRPQDLTALVDRLVEARDNARANNASLTVMHADFGKVSMHFAHDNGNLTVSLANNDPGFARAVNAAVAPDGGMNADTQPQGDRRGDAAPNGAPRASADEHGLPSERGGQPRSERHDRNGIAANPSHRETDEADQGSRGIFA